MTSINLLFFSVVVQSMKTILVWHFIPWLKFSGW